MNSCKIKEDKDGEAGQKKTTGSDRHATYKDTGGPNENMNSK